MGYVYKITNRINRKIYVGKTVQRNLQSYLVHKMWTAENSESISPLFRAIRKYGRDAFIIQSLVETANTKKLNRLERFYIRTLNSRRRGVGYNILEGGEGHDGYVTSEATKKKLSIIGRGKKRSAVTIERMRKAFLARTTYKQRVALSKLANKRRSEVLSAEERSRLAKIGSDAALAKLGPYTPKPNPKTKKCKTCQKTKLIDCFHKAWIRSVREPDKGRWSYRSECGKCSNIAKGIYRANLKKTK